MNNNNARQHPTVSANNNDGLFFDIIDTIRFDL